MSDYVNVYKGGPKDGFEEPDASPTLAEFVTEFEATQENNLSTITCVYRFDREEPQADRVLRHYQYVRSFPSENEASKFVREQTGRDRKPRF